jgi:hypothetical protein
MPMEAVASLMLACAFGASGSTPSGELRVTSIHPLPTPHAGLEHYSYLLGRACLHRAESRKRARASL